MRKQYIFTEEHKKNISKANKWNIKLINANLWKHYSEDTKMKMSIAKKGKSTWRKWIKRWPMLEETKRKISESNKKVIHTKEWNNKIWTSNKWKIRSLETLKKLSESHKWYVMPEEQKKKISKKLVWELSSSWKWWISYLPYSIKRTRKFKRIIRERDNRTCQICWETQWWKSYPIHHIDYNKLNCEENNLITLCKSCHAKTNHNRDYWIIYFDEQLKR